MSKRYSTLPTRTSFFISSAEKIKKCAGIQSETFRIAVYRRQPYKNFVSTCSSFH